MTGVAPEKNVRAYAARVAGLVVGVVALAFVVRAVGGEATLAALRRVARYVPALVALEVGIVAVNGLALASFYRAGGRVAPARPFWNAVFIGHLFAVTLPAGRFLAEGWKAARLSPHTGLPTAAAAAVGLQAATLLANAVGAFATTLAVWWRCGWTAPTWAVAALGAAMVGIGGGVALAGHAEVGRRIGARVEVAREAGAAFDGAYALASRGLLGAVAWETVGRALQCTQILALRAALGARAGALDALATYGLILTGAAVGDLVPAQLGATDAALTLAARRVGLGAADALALTLTLHAVQVGVGATGAAAATVARAVRR